MSFPAGAYRLLETLRGESGAPLRWRLHAERMGRSAAEFGLPFSLDRFGEVATQAASAGATTDCRIRVTLDGQGRLESEALPLPPVPERLRLVISEWGIASDSLLPRHKLLPRGVYDRARQEAEALGAWDGILLNEREELCETGRANLILLLRGELFTPALACGVLPGTVRRVLLEAGVVRESALPQSRLAHASALFVTNALAGVREVWAVDGAGFVRHPRDSRKALEVLQAALST